MQSVVDLKIFDFSEGGVEALELTEYFADFRAGVTAGVQGIDQDFDQSDSVDEVTHGEAEAD